MKAQFYDYIQSLQDRICQGFETLETNTVFHEDMWTRPEGGGGRTRVIADGEVFEKGGVNISQVFGELPNAMQKAFNVDESQFYACGLSLVIHPRNPFVPTFHANWRYFELYNAQGDVEKYWFGGGLDMTPYYLFEEDAVHFHQVCKTSCNAHHADLYAEFKQKCDDYFHNAHRQEARGIGGLFFDYLSADARLDKQGWYDFVTHNGDCFLEAVLPIIERRKDAEYSEADRYWQAIRRGRYVEFNLIHDRGTLFGLKTNGRIESILMSLPPIVRWDYGYETTTPEQNALLDVLKTPREWV